MSENGGDAYEGDGDEEFDELEKSVAMEEYDQVLKESVVPPADNEMEIETDPIIEEFGQDAGIINVMKAGEEYFFFVQNIEPVGEEQSYFNQLGKAFQGLKILPPKFDVDGSEIPSEDDDPNAIFFELYLPQSTIDLGEVELLAFMERGAFALRNLYFPNNVEPEVNVSKNSTSDNGSDEALKENVDKNAKTGEALKETPKQSVAFVHGNKMILDTSSLEKTLVNISTEKKSESAKQEEKKKQKKDLADLVFKDTDAFIPGREKITLELSEPIIPALLGLTKKDRRLTPTTWKEIRMKSYNLSPEQKEQMEPLAKLTGTDEEEAIIGGLAPPLAKALSSLIGKNLDYHLPMMKVYDLLWRARSSNDTEYALKLKTLPEAQTLIDDLMEAMQHQVMTQTLLSYQLKLQLGNVMSGLAKDRITSKIMLDKIKDNLDNNPDKGVMGNITKTMSSMAKTRQSLSKGGVMLVGKRPSQDISLTADTQPKRMKNYHLSVRNKEDKFFKDNSYQNAQQNAYQRQPNFGRDRGPRDYRGGRGGIQFGVRGGNPRGRGGSGVRGRGGQGGGGGRGKGGPPGGYRKSQQRRDDRDDRS